MVKRCRSCQEKSPVAPTDGVGRPQRSWASSRLSILKFLGQYISRFLYISHLLYTSCLLFIWPPSQRVLAAPWRPCQSRSSLLRSTGFLGPQASPLPHNCHDFFIWQPAFFVWQPFLSNLFTWRPFPSNFFTRQPFPSNFFIWQPLCLISLCGSRALPSEADGTRCRLEGGISVTGTGRGPEDALRLCIVLLNQLFFMKNKSNKLTIIVTISYNNPLLLLLFIILRLLHVPPMVSARSTLPWSAPQSLRVDPARDVRVFDSTDLNINNYFRSTARAINTKYYPDRHFFSLLIAFRIIEFNAGHSTASAPVRRSPIRAEELGGQPARLSCTEYLHNP